MSEEKRKRSADFGWDVVLYFLPGNWRAFWPVGILAAPLIQPCLVRLRRVTPHLVQPLTATTTTQLPSTVIDLPPSSSISASNLCRYHF